LLNFALKSASNRSKNITQQSEINFYYIYCRSLYQNNKQNINEQGFFVAGNNGSKTELICIAPPSRQQWFYVVPLLPTTGLAAGNNGFM
jgi:hypothetical protein